MPTIFEHKEQAATETPILLFDCKLRSGDSHRWSTHRVVVAGETYEPRVLRHNLFEIQTASDQGVDAIPRVSLSLANADSHFSQIERTIGFKGATVTVRFLFFKLKDGEPETESTILFRGTANSPDEITESLFRFTAVNRMSMQRVLLPPVRVQRRCPWEFPANSGQREEAVSGGNKGSYSRFYKCGYSADVTGGVGNSNGGTPFTSCTFTRSDCEQRGMFRKDTLLRPTSRFGGIEFVPSTILVRSAGEKGSHLSPVAENEARYNDFVPLIYGTAWHSPLIVFSRNDGNLTRMEVLLGMGEIESILKVLVNDIEIPLGRAGANMTGTGWFSVMSAGGRNGAFNLDFSDGGSPQGDPYGSMAYLSVVVPNRISDGRALPSVKVLMKGLKLDRFDSDGTFLSRIYTNNPAWILLDILERSGWSLDEIDISSFATAAAFCDEVIEAQDLFGNATTLPRFQCNFVLKKRRTAADVIRGIRNNSRLYLTYGAGGLLQLKSENTMALQQPVKAASSNSAEILDGGWPGYEFGDGTSSFSAILRRENGEPSLRMWSRSTTDTPNRFTVEFQDAFNEYQQDSLSLVDVEDVALTGQEITGPFSVAGIPNYDQAGRILKFNLDKSIQGNTYLEFETSVRAIGLQPGDLISLTYLKEGFERQPFRVLRIAPGVNYRTALITAQIHNDSWYSDTNGKLTGDGGRRQIESGLGLPRPLIGSVIDENGDIQFGIEETASEDADGGATVETKVSFLPPATVSLGRNGIPLLNLAPTFGAGGTLAGDHTFYYALSAVDGEGQETGLSFVVRATVPPGGNTNSVALTGLSFSSATVSFHVYRGVSPSQLFRIASNRPVATQFTDSGLPAELVAPPDRNYHHANFYWRLESQPESSATIHSATTIGNSTLQMIPNDYRGLTVLITRGKGAGQERGIASNTATLVTVRSAWTVAPDSTSYFSIAESGWHAGTTGSTSPVQFQIPNRTGATVQITGRAANANDKESPAELATVTRWVIGGAGSSGGDGDVPPLPSFGVGLPPNRGGVIEAGGIAFETFENTHTISTATFTLYYWGELGGRPQTKLSTLISATEQAFSLTSASALQAGSLVQVELEIMRVEGVLNSGIDLQVTRAIHGTAAVAHAANSIIYPLQSKVVIAPIARNFFGSPASGGWSFPIVLPDVRVASVEMFVTNQKGNSETAIISLTQTVDSGLRTLSGGQYSIEVEGFLAIEDGAAPDLVMEASHSVRDVYAVLRQSPTGAPVEIRLNQNGSFYCNLTIPSGAIISPSIDGLLLPPLISGARVTADITSVGQASPGSDLTIIIRL